MLLESLEDRRVLASNLGLDFNFEATAGNQIFTSSSNTLGYAFSVNRPIMVDGLAIFDDNGLTNAHQTRLWTATGTELASVNLDSSDTTFGPARTGGSWRFESIVPIELAPGSYVIAAHYPGTGMRDAFVRNPDTSNVSFANGVSFIQDVAIAGNTFPNTSDPTVSFGVFGPSFTILDSLNVTTLDDVVAADGLTSLREAIANANATPGSDTITFDPSLFNSGSRTITLNADSGEAVLRIEESLTITGPGADLLTINANQLDRIFTISSGDATTDFITATITGLTITNGQAPTVGGAFFIRNADVSIIDSELVGNASPDDGGAIYFIASNNGTTNGDNTRLTVRGTTIASNTSVGGGGGGIYSQGFSGATANLIVENSTISNNRADEFGGGVLQFSSNTVLRHVTVTGNHSNNDDTNTEGGGGIASSADGSLQLLNSIVAGNFIGSADTTPSDLAATTATMASGSMNNVIGDAGTSGSLVNGVDGNIVGNAGLGVLLVSSILDSSLALNGGTTRTHLLANGSPALDNAATLTPAITVDQRGTVRPQGAAADIGAVEFVATFDSTSITVTTADDELDANPENNLADISLREAILLANANPNVSVITFDSALQGTSLSLSSVGDTTLGNSMLAISSEVTIRGPVTISRDTANGDARLFYVDVAGTLTLDTLTLSGGEAIGGKGGDANGGGGGGGGGFGGAIFNRGTVNIVGSTLTNNRAAGGAGGRSGIDTLGKGGASGGSVLGDATDSTADNGATGLNGAGGGGDLVIGAGSPAPPNFTVLSGEDGDGTTAFGAGGGGGGFGEMTVSGPMTLSGGGQGGTGGFGGGGGGEGDSSGGSDAISQQQAAGGFGGGFGFGLGGGGGAGLGGGVFNDGGTVTVINSTLSGNSALGGDGGDGDRTRGITIPGQGGMGFGGAIFNRNGTITVRQSTLAENRTSAGSGANSDSGATAVYNLQESGQTATLNIFNTILASSISQNSDAINTDGTVIGNNNLISENGNFPTSVIVTSDAPILGPLQSNGGPTATHELLTGSPAIDAGDNAQILGLTTDQRGSGFDRLINDIVDIGAFESAPRFNIVISPTTALSVSESGSTATFTVVLSDAPTTNVVLNVVSGDTGEATVDVATLTFTPTDFDTPQTITVTGANDTVRDGDQSTNITVTVDDAISDDNYDPAMDQLVSVSITDDDTSMLLVVESNGSTSVLNLGTTDAVSVALSSQPLTNVVVNVSLSSTAHASLDVATLTFTPGNFATPQTVTVTGTNDNVENGDQTATIAIAVENATSDDLWDGVTATDVNVSIIEGRLDLGDAPAPFSTLLPSGASHQAVGPTLGVLRDIEPDGQPNATATGDDAAMGYADAIRVATGSTGTANSSAVGDLDGDGNLDLVVAISGPDSLAVLLGNGDGTFGTPTQVSVGAGMAPVFVVLDDFNGDERLDAAVANFGSSDVSLLLGNGDGTFATATVISLGSVAATTAFGVNQIASANVGGNASPDLLIVSFISDDVTVLINNGDGTFGAPQSFAAFPAAGVGGMALSLIVQDLNGDSVNDIAVANGFSNDVTVMLNSGTGTFPTAVPNLIDPTGTNGASGSGTVVAGNFGGDANIDLLTANNTSGDLSLLIGDGTGTFVAQAPIPLAGAMGLTTILAQDLDGDSNLDVVVTDQAGAVFVVLGNGDGTFQTATRLTGGLVASDSPFRLTLADLDDDGEVELISDVGGAVAIFSVAMGDEDGVVFPAEPIGTSLQGSVTVNLQNADPTSNRLDAWIDFDGDGAWDGVGEQIFTSFDLGTSNGPQTLTFDLPSGIVAGTSFARFRISTAGALSPTGFATDGEVEDHQVTLVAPPPTVTLAVDNATITEAGGVATFTATLSSISASPVTIDLEITGTATISDDYTRSTDQIVIPAGSLTASITVTAAQDEDDEVDETVVVDISGVTNAMESGTGQATTTILDDDGILSTPTVTLAVDNATIAEAGGVATFTATLSSVSTAPVTIDLEITGTATLADDYARSGVQIVIPAGSLTGFITVTSVQDTVDEMDETIIVDISGVTNGNEAGTGQATTTITDDDGPITTPVVNVSPSGPDGEADPDDLPGTIGQPSSWSIQRSSLRELVIDLPSLIAAATAADLVLTNLGVNADVDEDMVIALRDDQISLVNGGMQLQITFDVGQVTEGVYKLDLLTGITGGDTFTLIGNSVNKFYVLTGDWNGSGAVTPSDFATFAYWFGQQSNVAPGYVDLTPSSSIGISDFAPFAASFGKSIVFPAAGLGSMVLSSGEGELTVHTDSPDNPSHVNSDGPGSTCEALEVASEVDKNDAVNLTESAIAQMIAPTKLPLTEISVEAIDAMPIEAVASPNMDRSQTFGQLLSTNLGQDFPQPDSTDSEETTLDAVIDLLARKR